MRDIKLEVPGVKEVFLIKRKGSKRLSLSMGTTGVLKISIPYFLSYKDAESMVSVNKGWVEKYISKMQAIEANHEDLPLDRKTYTRDEARSIIEKRVCDLSGKFGLRYAGINISELKTRWGSCTGKNFIKLNIKIIRLPRHLMDYVIVHELVHTRVKNHKSEFWNEIEKYMPGGKERDRAIRKYYPIFL